MSAAEPASTGGRPVREACCVVFAYHEIGYACMAQLAEMGAPIAALFTHQDNVREEIWWRSCAELARRRGIPAYSPEKLGDEWVEHIAAMKPAVIYSFYYRNLIADEVLRLAAFGAYNLHGSMLPKYRGRAPVNWMLVNGEREAGVTLHHMIARADAGDIVAQRGVPITDDDTALTLYRKLVPMAATLVREFHPLIIEGIAPRRRQVLAEGSYFGRRRPEDGRIDWNWPARQIFNLVRAVTHPYPGAFCGAEGRKLLIWRSRIKSETGICGLPGEIIGESDEGSIDVAAGAGSLTVSRVQFEGGPEMDATDALPRTENGWRIARLA
jgi:methionyl-tRNA formyltransferase